MPLHQSPKTEEEKAQELARQVVIAGRGSLASMTLAQLVIRGARERDRIFKDSKQIEQPTE